MKKEASGRPKAAGTEWSIELGTVAGRSKANHEASPQMTPGQPALRRRAPLNSFQLGGQLVRLRQPDG